MKWFKAAILVTGALVLFSAVPVQAQGIWGACGEEGSETANNTICGDRTEATVIVKNIVNLFLYIIGILSVILIIHSGLKYINSRGDAESVKSAKNTLLYAIVGLIVAMLAFTIVNFVIDQFKQEQPPLQGPPAPESSSVQGSSTS